ncbi:MAG: hypothetical protein JO352_07805 [Chloroflexi bacterium]|nr:hypothetical protein [Chloroflexota bacterium]MBV9600426.1 hypothetical protein [Chloroflexota bacterium]
MTQVWQAFARDAWSSSAALVAASAGPDSYGVRATEFVVDTEADWTFAAADWLGSRQ